LGIFGKKKKKTTSEKISPASRQGKQDKHRTEQAFK
jgi:hypothetical protein